MALNHQPNCPYTLTVYTSQCISSTSETTPRLNPQRKARFGVGANLEISSRQKTPRSADAESPYGGKANQNATHPEANEAKAALFLTFLRSRDGLDYAFHQELWVEDTGSILTFTAFLGSASRTRKRYPEISIFSPGFGILPRLCTKRPLSVSTS